MHLCSFPTIPPHCSHHRDMCGHSIPHLCASDLHWLLANTLNSLASAVKSWCIRLSSSYFLGWTARWDEPEQAFRRLLTYGLCLLVAQVESIKTCHTHTHKNAAQSNEHWLIQFYLYLSKMVLGRGQYLWGKCLPLLLIFQEGLMEILQE